MAFSHRHAPSSILLLALSCLIAISSSSSSSAAALNSPTTCFPPDLAALQAFAASFYSSLTARFFLSEWRPDIDCCKWVGVSCAMMSSTNTSRVVAVSLPNRNLYGPFPHALCGLSALSSLNLSTDVFSAEHNLLWGPIPSCIAHNLTRLQILDLSYTGIGQSPQLSGSASPLVNLPHLIHLDLSHSFFTGPLPVFNTPSLQYLDLSDNSFYGTLPIFNTPSLQYLDLSGNGDHSSYNSDQLSLQLSGSVSPLVNLSHLTHLYLSENSFGTLMPIFNTPNLQYLDVSDNLFSGHFPPFNTSPNLQHLDLSYCNMQWEGASSIAQLFCDLTSLKFLAITPSSVDRFGKLDQSPQCERPSVNLTHLDLSSNGPLPPWIGMFPKLQYLQISTINFSGSIPQEWQALTHLTSLHLISSDSPPTPHVYLSQPTQTLPLFRLPLEILTLQSMGLTAQHFQCKLGLSLLNQTLRSLDLSQNLLSDGHSLWHCLAHHNFTLSDLSLSNNPLNLNLALSSHPLVSFMHPLHYDSSTLDLSYCQLFGDLSMEILSSAGYIYLAHNYLTGSIPTQIGSLASRNEWLDLSFNNLTGTIPTSMGNLSSTQEINLNNNHLDGEISLQGLGNRQLNSLQLASNSFTRVSLRNIIVLMSLDLSFNKLEGELQELLGDYISTNSVFNSLFVLLLGHNQLTGSVSTFSRESAPNLVVMDLSNNKLTGTIPESLKLLQCLRLVSCEEGIILGYDYSLQSVKRVIQSCAESLFTRSAMLLPLNMYQLRRPIMAGYVMSCNGLRNGSPSQVCV